MGSSPTSIIAAQYVRRRSPPVPLFDPVVQDLAIALPCHRSSSRGAGDRREIVSGVREPSQLGQWKRVSLPLDCPVSPGSSVVCRTRHRRVSCAHASMQACLCVLEIHERDERRRVGRYHRRRVPTALASRVQYACIHTKVEHAASPASPSGFPRREHGVH